MHDRPTATHARHQRAREASATAEAFVTALDAEIALDRRNAAIRHGRTVGLSLRTLARATRLSHETIRRIGTGRPR